MRLLITGASGLLGLNLALHAEKAHDVVGVDRNSLSSVPFKVIKADLLEPNALKRIIDEVKPEAIIHCAAMADIDLCERSPMLAQQANTELPAKVADICARHSLRLVHISTDAVFDGQKIGAYSEMDTPNPLGIYAKTKFNGEEAVVQLNPDAIVARVNFYGWSVSGNRSLAEFFVNNLQGSRTVNGFTDVTFCPMFVYNLGEILLKMLERGFRGRYHVVGPEPMTKYQFGVEIARKFGLKEDMISPLSVEKSRLNAVRSHNLWLSTNKISTDLKLALPNFSTGLNMFFEQYQEGYPQKIRSYQQ